MTKQHTITFIASTKTNRAIEINYEGKIIWKAPEHSDINPDGNLFYHHEFTRLDNGNYMVISNEKTGVYMKKNKGDSSLYITNKPEIPDNISLLFPETLLGMILEFDKMGKLVWFYKTSNYFIGSDLINYTWPKGVFDPRINSFYFDENEKMLYISFKSISRIIKVKYPEGITLNSYGKMYKQPIKSVTSKENRQDHSIENSEELFCGQHSCRSTKDGYLYCFNNNECRHGSLPTIVMMQQPHSSNDSLKKIWEFTCEPEKEDQERIPEMVFSSGGNVDELPDGSFFCSMSSGYSKTFIVSRDKEVLWSAMAEKWNPDKNKWDKISIYRSSIISSREDLENLIMNSETTK
jgi:hypothetical protein